MYILFRHFDGRFQEGLVLSLGSNSMRVSIPGGSDVVELTLREGQWISEEYGAMEIEFIAATAEDEWNRFFDRRLVQREIDAWAAKPLPLDCVPAPAAAGALWN
jgi:hypothetical protein